MFVPFVAIPLVAAVTLQLPSTGIVADWSVTDSITGQVTRYIVSHDDSRLIIGTEIADAGAELEYRDVFTVPFAQLSCVRVNTTDGGGRYFIFTSAAKTITEESATAVLLNGQVDEWQTFPVRSTGSVGIEIDPANKSVIDKIGPMFDRYRPNLPINKGDCSGK